MGANWNQLIERYLNNELSAEGKEAFETELKRNPELQKEFELHRLTHELIQRSSLRRLVEQSGKWFHLKKILVKGALVLAVAGILAAAGYVLLIRNDQSKTEATERLDQSMLEKLDKYLAFDRIDPQYFRFTGKSDVFLSESGVLLSLTENSFLLDGTSYNGEALVQWQEVQTPAEIVKAGLSTTSGDRLLETQGMFSLNAFTPEGKKLELSKEGVYVQVPVDEVKNGMKLFQGVPQKGGKIDWQNPVELERIPKQKSMSEIDLYPPKYEPKLNELKWFTEKKKRDSLYLSFEEEQAESRSDITEIVYDSNYESIKKKELLVGSGTPVSAYPADQYLRGKLLFETKCSTCHMVHKNTTGPKLFRVREKWANGGAKEGSIYQWVADWSRAAASDPYAREVSRSQPIAMNQFPELAGKTKDIDAIFDYIDGIPFPGVDSVAAPSHIPPSKVLAIWNPKFDHTILATQDFEDRMKAIHQTCNEKVFDVYAKNLHEPLWKLDERVVKMGYAHFRSFADQRVGKVELDAAHQKNLDAFYEEAVKTIRERGKKELEAALKKERDWDDALHDEREKEFVRKGLLERLSASEEARFNLVHVSKQLGKTVGFSMTSATTASGGPPDSGSVPEETHIKGGPAIVNIDRLTEELLSSRSSVDVYTLDKSKKAQIRYSEFKTDVRSFKDFDRLYFYLFPNRLNSYERLDFVNGSLKYTLNDGMRYSGLAFGLNKDGFFLFEIPSLENGDLGSIKLQQVTEREFESRLKKLNEARGVHAVPVADELSWLFREKANYQVQRQRRENRQFRKVIRPTIYVCLSTEAENPVSVGIEEKVFDVTDSPAEFPGGMSILRRFLSENIQFPQSALNRNFSGKVYVRFIVDADGKISNATIKRGIPDCPECDEEALRVVKKMPAFKPGVVNNRNVASYFTLPIMFSLQ
ncbi:TonB family protein [Fluviicola sp.]|uniref:TonB family protein n=1 Tax=Fluviicola sp. TaxID=1917219 RepID=UPI0031E0491B